MKAISKKSKHAEKLVQIEGLVAQGMSGNQASKKVGLHPQVWYSFRSKRKPKVRSRRKPKPRVEDLAFPAQFPVAKGPVPVFAFVGYTDEVSEVLQKMFL
ncbi:MAG: hypothetical protein E6Q97_32905 [Desulfurellales bacterium]|nr:MAG: hypothetical protein E6Q97_32905 [Desulfurellales bacterium]